MKKKLLSNRIGISLMEVMVVIVIIGILLLIWKFSASGHVRLAVVNEGRTLIEQIVAQERMYRARTGVFKAVSDKSSDADIMIDTYDNKYFKNFTVTSKTYGIDVTVVGDTATKASSGISIIGAYTASNNSLSITENGL